jgi:hypothetical protein
MVRNKSDISQASDDPILSRLDALIRLTFEANRSESKMLTEPEVARMLKSVGITPTEIARILGKKSRTDVSAYLYQK